MKMNLFPGLIAVMLLFTSFSCKRAHRISAKAKETIQEKKSAIGDKIIAHFDPYHPDTRFNKIRFEEFFAFAPTPDVHDIYCYADEMGIDHDYQFAFYCDSSTVNQIIQKLRLDQQGPLDNNTGNNFWHPFPWWDSLAITKIRPHSARGDHNSYQYLWYDTTRKKAFYFSFDM